MKTGRNEARGAERRGEERRGRGRGRSKEKKRESEKEKERSRSRIGPINRSTKKERKKYEKKHG